MSDRESEGDISADEEGDDEMSQKLALFQEITGISDTTRSQRILDSHQWNVEAAVQDAFNEQEGIRPVFNQPIPPPLPLQHNTQPPRLPMNVPHQPYRPAIVHNVGWVQWLLSWGFLPIRWVLSITNELYQTLVGLIFGNQPAIPSDPVGDVNRFITQFEDEYGTEHPEYLSCSYSDALERAKRDLSFLLVYLHSSGHRDTSSFCRDVLCSQSFRDTLLTHNCLFWAAGIESEEGARVSYTLRESTYPFLALIMLRGSRMTVIHRIEGYGSVEDVVNTLQQSMAHNEPELVVLRAERHQRSMDQRLRVEQEKEYERSLKADQEKARKRKEELNEIARQAELEKQKLDERKRLIEDFERERQVRVARLPSEPPAEAVDSSSIVHIIIKMPNGDRIGRRFYTTDQLQSLYDFAYTYTKLPKLFSIFTSYPKKELVCNQDGGPTLEELDFTKKMLVFVQSTSEEDEEEDY